MILGIPIITFTLIHVALSLTGIFSGVIVVLGMFNAKLLEGWTAFFLASTVFTSMTGFYFPSVFFAPSHAIGIISMVVLAIAILAFYAYRLAGPWRWVYVMSAILALYLNICAGVVQAFQKLSFLRSHAPTLTELPFIVTQIIVMMIFVVIGAKVVRSFHPEINYLE